MGNDGSKDGSRQHPSLASFSSSEKERVIQLFSELSHSTKELREPSLQAHIDSLLPAPVCHKLYKLMLDLHVKHGDHVTSIGFYTALSYILRGSADQQANVIYRLASNQEGQLQSKYLLLFVEEILTAYIHVVEKRDAETIHHWYKEAHLQPASATNIHNLAKYLLYNLLYPNARSKVESDWAIPDVTLTQNDILAWLAKSNFFINCLCYVFHHIFPVADRPMNSLLPTCHSVSSAKDQLKLLDLCSVLAITNSLPLPSRDKWTLMFDSRQNGESFTNLLRNVKNQKNTVLLVRDRDGHVFGGFNSAVWSNHPAFQGSTDCFLFSINPVLDIYEPTGLNTNYFYLNSGQETLPNGMGMGGQLEYFGLWLNIEYGSGHCKAKPLSTTYHSPQLSKQEQFTYHDLQVWKVTGLIEEEALLMAAEEEGVTSILDKDAGAKAILEMIGKGHHSDGLRESDPTASNPEELEKPKT